MSKALNHQPHTNNDLVARSLRSVWHPCTQMQHHETLPLVPVSHGRGAWLYDTEGQRYLDAISSWWVNHVWSLQSAHQQRR
jgi:adenosylmethionine-8-amino-7-oxononanoate aminotransferase